jgi:glutamate synthase (NADPH/NADH) small chain
VEGGEFTMDSDLILIAIGFAGAVRVGLLEQLPLELGARGAVVADETSFMTSSPGVFVAGDMRRGQSLVVWAIAEGRKAAAAIDHYMERVGSFDRDSGMVAAM